MITPFQRLLVCSRQGQKHFGTVLVASGPSLYAFNTSDGHFLSKWSHSQNASDNANTGRARSPDEQGPPGKRRKLTPPSTGASGQNSPEIITDNGLNERKKPKIPVPNVPAIINLCSTSDGKHIIAVTGEDKCIRVLTLSEDGILEELSQRAMPKRPNALSLTADEKTILCGDKFGDVYAIPLIEDPDWKAENEPHADMNKSIEQSQTAEEMFKSAANSLTVHSKRNRKTLEAQQKQKVAAAKAQKPVMQFQYQHLLGHVSLLTDVTSIRLETAEGPRDYILSSDRDEHIRVSRGIPQAHIIENYCLGHSQFISKICSLKWRPDILVSGGGDDYLLFWDWVSGTVRQEVDLREPCEAVRTTLRSDTGPTEGLSESGIVVSGIWALQTGDSEGLIIVICEG
jgi:tRNA (guanine-N(7)-)-methyltransferase subunit TRM82